MAVLISSVVNCVKTAARRVTTLFREGMHVFYWDRGLRLLQRSGVGEVRDTCRVVTVLEVHVVVVAVVIDRARVNAAITSAIIKDLSFLLMRKHVPMLHLLTGQLHRITFNNLRLPKR